jgi:hypothetical protein
VRQAAGTMSRWADRWIVVENWDKFQARRERPGAPWIKLYLSLLQKPEWLDMCGSPADQVRIIYVWLYYAETDGRLRVSDLIRWIPREPGVTPKRHHERITRGLTRLNHAGFIRFCFDRPLPLSSTTVDARAREAARINGGSSSRPCPLCEVGGGQHTADCPTLQLPQEPS